jgi:hypothetical protein
MPISYLVKDKRFETAEVAHTFAKMKSLKGNEGTSFGVIEVNTFSESPPLRITRTIARYRSGRLV